MRKADRFHLVVGAGRGAAERAGRDVRGFIDRMILRDRVRQIDRQEDRRAAAIACGGCNGVRGDLAVDRSDGEKGIRFLAADRFRKLGGGELGRYRPWLGSTLYCCRTTFSKFTLASGAADNSDAMAGELCDILRFPSPWRRLFLPFGFGGTHKTATSLRSVATACAFFGTSRSPRMIARSARSSDRAAALAIAPSVSSGCRRICLWTRAKACARA